MNRMPPELHQFAADEDGVTLVEYALVAGLIAVFCVASVAAFGTELLGLYTRVCQEVTGAIAGMPGC